MILLLGRKSKVSFSSSLFHKVIQNQTCLSGCDFWKINQELEMTQKYVVCRFWLITRGERAYIIVELSSKENLLIVIYFGNGIKPGGPRKEHSHNDYNIFDRKIFYA